MTLLRSGEVCLPQRLVEAKGFADFKEFICDTLSDSPPVIIINESPARVGCPIVDVLVKSVFPSCSADNTADGRNDSRMPS